MNKAVFLDRDGVINKNRVDYVKNWGEFIFLPFALDALQLWTKNEFSIFIMTNQSCIARKILTKDELTAIHEKMLKEIEAADGNITYIYYCPHKPEDNCDCRKPKAGMFFQAEQQFNIDLLTSYFVGDNITDALAAQNAGCKFSFVETGMCTRKDIIPYDPDFVGPNLLEVAKHTIKESQE